MNRSRRPNLSSNSRSLMAPFGTERNRRISLSRRLNGLLRHRVRPQSVRSVTFIPTHVSCAWVLPTTFGGLNRNRQWNKKQPGRGPSGKTTVIGAISHKGNVVCKIIEDTSMETMSRFALVR